MNIMAVSTGQKRLQTQSVLKEYEIDLESCK